MRRDPGDRRPPRKPSLRPGGGKKAIDREKILAIAGAVVATRGCELLERTVSDTRRIRLVVDRESAAPDTKLLVGLIRATREALAAAGIDPGGFDIEVDSPGEERVLLDARHFERFRGQRVRVTLAEPDPEGRPTFLATLAGADGDAPRVVLEDGEERTLAAGTWRQIRLAPPPGRRPGGGPAARPVPKGKRQKQARRERRNRDA